MISLLCANEVLHQCHLKSGTTTGASLAFRVLRKLLEDEWVLRSQQALSYALRTVPKGTLKQLADAQGWPTFVVPDDVGGRYSVLSRCGPAAHRRRRDQHRRADEGRCRCYGPYLRAGARTTTLTSMPPSATSCTAKGKVSRSWSATRPDFTLMNEWYKQLFGESEGKDNKGLFPRKLHLLHRPALHGSVHPGRLPHHVRDHRGRQEARKGPVHRPAGGQL